MLVSVAICGGGVDSGNKAQIIVGLIMFLVFAGGIAIEGIKEDVEHHSFNNTASYPCFLRK